MAAEAEVVDDVAAGLGWPRDVHPDPLIGWPNVPRETLEWTSASHLAASSEESAFLVSDPELRPSADREEPAADRSDIPRPPGPRRARFDEDEFAPPPAAESDDQGVSRETAASVASLPAPASTRVFVVANQKGGVGKTTSSVNLAAALALGGLSVLLIDLDPQGNASTALGVDHQPGTPGTYDVLIAGDSIADHVVDSPEAPRLKVLPATIDLAGAEIELVSVVARENRLLRSLSAYLKDDPVDYVFLDCPPSLGLLTLNALVAATEILIPIQCEYYALEGVSQLMRTINLVKGELNSELRLSTVLLTMFDGRTRLAAQVANEVRTHFSEETLPTVIPRSVRISEAPSYGQTVLTYHPDSAGAVSYLKAAQEIAHRGAKETR
jgi:chromosome partitioning protein